MKKILFMIHDLGGGGAEKVLVNLVNNMDKTAYDITVMALFGGGVNEKYLNDDIRLINCHEKAYRGNSHVMKLFTPKQLFKKYVKKKYDIIVAYLEGPSTRIVSGCDDEKTKLVCWVHSTLKAESFSESFKNTKEAKACYNKFEKIICVSKKVAESVSHFVEKDKLSVLYNTNESEKILSLAKEKVTDHAFDNEEINLCSVGRLTIAKAYDRLVRIHQKLRDEGIAVHTYILGTGELKESLEKQIADLGVKESFTLLGYKDNPYKYVKECDVFVCSSISEGFSTAATEALLLGRAIITTDVSGMDELLDGGEYGMITENDEEELYKGLKKLLSDRNLIERYQEKAQERSAVFDTKSTVSAVCEMLESL